MPGSSSRLPSDHEPLLGWQAMMPTANDRSGLADGAQPPLMAPTSSAGTTCDVFISYCRKDKEFIDHIKNLHGSIQQIPLNCFLDTENIEAGEVGHNLIQSALHSASCFIVFVSSSSLNSEYIKKYELPHIVDEWSKSVAKVIPVLVDDCRTAISVCRVDRWQYVVHSETKDLMPLTYLQSSRKDVSSIFDSVLKQVVNWRHSRRQELTESGAGHQPPKRLSFENVIQVMGWSGIEERTLYNTFPKKAAFLTAEMSFSRLPILKYVRSVEDRPRNFDVIYVDAEFIPRYRSLGLIRQLSDVPRIKNLCAPKGPIEPVIRKAFFGKDKYIYGVPIQFGFNEPLVNTAGRLGPKISQKVNNPAYQWSYADFDIEELIADQETTVAIWHWYLPSLHQISLAAEAREKTAKPSNGKHFLRYLKRLQDWLKKTGLKSQLMICRSLDEVRNALDPRGDFRAGIVLGVGSSALFADASLKVRAIVPQEGVVMWLNCAAILTAAGEGEDITGPVDMIEHWLQDATQEKMFFANTGYNGMPVNRNVLRALVSDENSMSLYPALKTLLNVTTFGDRGGQQQDVAFRDTVIKRKLGSAALNEWPEWWEEFWDVMRS